MKSVLVIFFLLSVIAGLAQDYPLTGHFQNLNEKDIYYSEFNTLVRPATGAENTLYDSLIFTTPESNRRTWFGRKLFDEHLVVAQDPDFKIIINPVIDFRLNKSFSYSFSQGIGYLNTRGINIYGNLSSKIFFNTSFTENQGVLPYQIFNYYSFFKVIPGFGRVKQLSGFNKYDFTNAYGSVSLKAADFLNFTLGYDRLFIGDGYRSMILSDFSAPMMYFKSSARFGKFEYNNIFTKAINPNFNNVMDLENPTAENSRYPSKYISLNTLTYSPNRAWQISLVESLVMSDDLPDWKIPLYTVSPFFRTAYIDSYSNLTNNLVGANVTWQNQKAGIFYAQLIIDSWYTNEQTGSIQTGYKNFDFFNVENLYFQFEYNRASTKSYMHYNNELHYGHYNQALSHPAGQSFNEFVFITDYKTKRFEILGKINFLKYFNPLGSSFQNIFNYIFLNNIYPEYLPGVSKLPTIINGDFQIIYNINKSNKLQVFAGISTRIDFFKNASTNFLQFGLRTAIRSNYYDF